MIGYLSRRRVPSMSGPRKYIEPLQVRPKLLHDNGGGSGGNCTVVLILILPSTCRTPWQRRRRASIQIRKFECLLNLGQKAEYAATHQEQQKPITVWRCHHRLHHLRLSRLVLSGHRQGPLMMAVSQPNDRKGGGRARSLARRNRLPRPLRYHPALLNHREPESYHCASNRSIIM